MSTTVTYKGNTLTTATNQTRTLETAGKQMEDDVTITDVTSIPQHIIKLLSTSSYAIIQIDAIGVSRTSFVADTAYTVGEGDTVIVRCVDGGSIYYDGTLARSDSSSTISYSFSIPASDILIKFSESEHRMDITTTKQYTATIISAGNSTNCYVQYNNVKYYARFSTFNFLAGDSLICYTAPASVSTGIWINEELVAEGTSSVAAQYTLTLPNEPLTITPTESTSNRKMWIEYPVLPSFYLNADTTSY